jgi:hypothetical protein
MKTDKTGEGASPPVRDVRSDFSAEESFKRLVDVGRRVVNVTRAEIEQLEQRRRKRKQTTG